MGAIVAPPSVMWRHPDLKVARKLGCKVYYGGVKLATLRIRERDETSNGMELPLFFRPMAEQ